MKRTPQGRNRDAKTSFNQKDREYAIYAAKDGGDQAVAASNQYTNEQISNVHQVPPGGTTGQALTKASNTDFDTTWSTVGGGGGGGDVTGPGSSTNNHIAQFDGTTGKAIKDGGLSSASFDAAGAATTAQANAEAYADSLAANYDPAGAASTAQTAAEAFATAADATVLSTSEAYTDAAVAGVSVPTAANPTATASDTAVNGVATTFMRSDAAPLVQKGSASQFGIVKVDGTTITESGGVISATPGAAVKPGLATIIGGWPVNLSGNQ